MKKTELEKVTEERDNWIFNAKELQKQANELDKQVRELRMKSWTPITRENTRLGFDGPRPTEEQWAKLHWQHARVDWGNNVCLILKGAALYPDLYALKVALPARVAPVKIPNFYGVPNIAKHGWIWMVASLKP